MKPHPPDPAPSRFRKRAWLTLLTSLLPLGGAPAAPLPPLGKIDITGTVAEARWVPKAELEGRKGMSGSLGRDRVIPAHLVVTLRDFSGPSARQAWMMNGFMGVGIDDAGDRTQPPPTLVVWVNTEDRKFLKAGMRIRLVNYTVTGDEGGTWTSCDRVERLEESGEPSRRAETPAAAGVPRKFSARIGGMLGTTFLVELRDGALLYTTKRGPKTGETVTIRPDPEQWRKFRASLDEVDIWRWEPRHVNPRILDGTQWSLEIEYPDRAIKSVGSNSYPDDKGKPNGKPETTRTFRRYLAAVEQLLGDRTFK